MILRFVHIHGEYSIVSSIWHDVQYHSFCPISMSYPCYITALFYATCLAQFVIRIDYYDMWHCCTIYHQFDRLARSNSVNKRSINHKIIALTNSMQYVVRQDIMLRKVISEYKKTSCSSACCCLS